MQTKLLISVSLERRQEEINEILERLKIEEAHPDLLYMFDEEKLGVEAAKNVRGFLSMRPVQALGRVVVIESAQNLTNEAQNSLLKTLEEPPVNATILLAADSESSLLPTILSRCQIVHLQSPQMSSLGSTRGSSDTDSSEGPQNDIERLIAQSVEERFAYIEKLEEKEALLGALVQYFREQMMKDPFQVKKADLLLEAEAWSKANVNPRAILEYLMLSL